MSKPFVHTKRFYGHFGRFYAVWSAAELNIDLTIGRILKIPPEQTHTLVAGMQFGRVTHIKNFVQLADDFEKALNISHDELEVFAKAALPPKSTTAQTD